MTGCVNSTSYTKSQRQILRSWKNLPLGIEFCLHHGGSRWPEWERRIISSLRRASPNSYLLIFVGVRYARLILKGRWHDLEPFLFRPPYYRHLVWYMQRDIVGSRWKEMEDAVLNGTCDPLIRSSYAVCYAKQIIQGRWRKAESIILADSADPLRARWHESGMKVGGITCPVEYALQVIKGTWWKLEQEIVAGRSHITVGVDYAERIRKSAWRGLERQLLLSQPTPLTAPSIVKYACFTRCKRWPAGEKVLLSHPPGDRVLSLLVAYASAVVGKRWRKVEALIMTCPKHLLEYADSVMRGRLPAVLHQAMHMHTVMGDPDAKKYFHKYGP